MSEVWRPVVGWESTYEVSNHGRVRSVARQVTCNLGMRNVSPRILIQSGERYLKVTLNDGGSCVATPNVHRLVADAFLIGSGECVRHLNGNSKNNSVSNLAWGSNCENEADKITHGRKIEGVKHYKARLGMQEVAKARQLHVDGYTHVEIARLLGVSKRVIGAVVRMECYRNIPMKATAS